MQDIDFLPEQYRQSRATRHWKPWRLAVVLGFLLLLGGVSLGQYRCRQDALRRLDLITPPYQTVVAQTERLDRASAQLQPARFDAQLITYLRHPWPRTRILAAVISVLPDDATLDQLQITYDTQPGRSLWERGRRLAGRVPGGQEKQPALAPAAEDLQRLRQRYDEQETVVLISGTVLRSVSAYRYLEQLGKSGLFVEAPPPSVQSVSTDDGTAFTFEATLTVRPGIGQPGGPTSAAERIGRQTPRFNPLLTSHP